ncbi:sensor histidine kinase [Hansschlegelia zhihuaiae]|uniref:Sensor histidine kinase n=1 Tax=Hansschlegelia zhihuaiae TaxID=405005 RepID=A0A4Q0MKH3_9HYPH|nr:sensor histidine kinase [Hansschlegelia zhihuaiae]RXF73506.1 sensor histidine kinase [Hansschlegelia zhihuaiae]
MEADPNLPEPSFAPDDARLAALRHRFRNQTQTMTSLLGLFGRRLPAGPCRVAFEDMRIRFEAAAFDPFPDADPTDLGPRPADLAAFAKRALAMLDPDFVHRVSIEGDQVRAAPRRACALAQIIAELLICLVREGFAGRVGSGRVTISASGDGETHILVLQTDGSAGGRPIKPSEATELGLQLASSLVRSLGGRLSIEAAGPFRAEATIPSEPQER